jgi:hypothetical protein
MSSVNINTVQGTLSLRQSYPAMGGLQPTSAKTPIAMMHD